MKVAVKVPRTTSKNPVTILRNVIKAIQDEPKRYKQTVYCRRRTETPLFTPDRGWPSCGTIGCVALWTCVVTGHATSGEQAMYKAQKILGLESGPANKLFAVTALLGFTDSTPGTKKYAEAGVDHIKNFVKKQWGVTL